MRFERLAIPDVVLIVPDGIGDARGYFREVFRENLFEEAVGPLRRVQENQAFSREAGTIRGLHFQMEPKAQGKLVSCDAGAIFDVAVDLREGSPDYGRHVGVELAAESGSLLWVPPGFAHGYCTLEPDTKVRYSVTDYYSPEHERGLAFDDPALGVAWPVAREKAIVSAKDLRQPRLAELGTVFTWRPSAGPLACERG